VEPNFLDEHNLWAFLSFSLHALRYSSFTSVIIINYNMMLLTLINLESFFLHCPLIAFSGLGAQHGAQLPNTTLQKQDEVTEPGQNRIVKDELC